MFESGNTKRLTNEEIQIDFYRLFILKTKINKSQNIGT